MRLQDHIEVILAECRKIERDRHAKKDLALWSAVEDVKIAAQKVLEHQTQRLTNKRGAR